MEVLVSKHGSVVKVELNRPEVRNSFNPEMIRSLTEIFCELASPSEKETRVVVLSGAGKVFCAGADLNWMRSTVKFTHDQNKVDAEYLYEMFEAIYDCPVPVVGSIQGAAFGGALGLVAACDVAIVEKKTQFCFSEVRLGLAPAVISSFVAKKARLSQVAPWMLNGAVMNSGEALSLGLVSAIADGTEALNDAVMENVSLFLEAGPRAVRATKKLIRDLSHQSDSNSKAMTSQLIADLRVGSEGQEGLTAFLEKRKPRWQQPGDLNEKN